MLLLSGCYVLSAKLQRVNADTLRLGKRLQSGGYAVEWAVTVDSMPAFEAVWYPGPLDSVYAIWIHVHEGLHLEGIIKGNLTARTQTQRVTGQRTTC